MTYQESKYLADPDYIAAVEVEDELLGHKVLVEIGFAYKRFAPGSRKQQGVKIVLSPGLYEKQLLYEATALEMVPFRRSRPDEGQNPETKPRQTYRPVATLAR